MSETVSVAKQTSAVFSIAQTLRGTYQTEDALVENYDKYQEFYNFLLNHQEVRKDLVHLLVDDLYNGLHNKESE